MVVPNTHKLDLEKSPLSGRHITETDLRRRAYGYKCQRVARLCKYLQEETLSLPLDLFDRPPTFEACGATLVCNWSDVHKFNVDLCDLVIARIGTELARSQDSCLFDGKAFFDNQRELETMLKRVQAMKVEVVERMLYGRKTA